MNEKCNVETIANLLMITTRRVQQLASKGIIPKTGRGEYELVSAVQGYIGFLKDQAERPSSGSGENGPDYYEERAKLYQSRARDAALTVALKEGRLVLQDDAVKLLREQAAAIRAAIEASESAIADKLAGRVWSQREIAQAVRDAHVKAQKRLTIGTADEPSLVRHELPEGWDVEEPQEDDEDDADI